MLWAVVALYAITLVAVAIRSRSHSSADEFLMANRQASALQVGAGLFTLIGGGEFVALASLGFLFGWSGIALFVGYGLGFLFLGLISGRIRRDSREERFVSLPDYVHHHFGSASGLLAFLFSFVAFFALLMLQFSAAGAVITPFLKVPDWVVVVGVGLGVLAYLLIGGFKAVLTTDVIQGVAMAVVLPILVFLVFKNGGQEFQTIEPSFDKLPISLWASLVTTGFFVVAASADVWQRAYAAESDAKAAAGFVGGGIAFVLFGFIIVAIGMLAKNLGLEDPDGAFVEVMTTYLTPAVAGLVALLVLSAMMSTADTEMFLLTGLTQHEIRRFAPMSRQASFLESVIGVRTLMALIALLSIGYAHFYSDLVGIYTWLLSALVVISPIVLFSLFIKASKVGMFLALLANTVLFAVLVGINYLTLDNIYLIALPGLVFYMVALAIGRR